MHTRAVGRWTVLASLSLVAVHSTAAFGQEVRTLTEAYNASGQALFEVLARKPGNVVISPYSIGTAMAMALAGARGETERQMAQVLKLKLSPAATAAANGALLALLNGYDRSGEPGYCPQGAKWTGTQCEAPPSNDRRCPPRMHLGDKLCVGQPIGPSAGLITANALMLTPGRGHLISGQYRALLRDKYGAAVHEGAGLAEVNRWVREKTQGKIERILDQLDPEAAAVLLNAVYLKAAWASPFSKGATREEDFHLSGKERVRVRMMHKQQPFALMQGPGYRALRLDYVVRSLGMVIVLPDEVEGLGAVAKDLDAARLARLMAGLTSGRRSEVALALPRFKAQLTVGLVPVFKAAGMTLAFNPKAADLGGMLSERFGRTPLSIDDIQHRAVIEVTEAGTEAAAATAVSIVSRAAPPKEPPSAVPFVVDRPFLFFVVDDASGAILFQGRIADPR
jgi:serpin B